MQLSIASRFDAIHNHEMRALVLPQLTSYRPRCTGSRSAWPHLQGLPLADPRYTSDDPVEILLGADVYVTILLDGVRKGPTDTPVVQKSVFGWLISRTVVNSFACFNVKQVIIFYARWSQRCMTSSSDSGSKMNWT